MPALALLAASALGGFGCGDAPKSETRPSSGAAMAPFPPRAAVSVPSATAPPPPEPAALRRPVADADLAVAPSWVTGRSPLERAPGYIPPADPESASVRLGRRDAKPVDDEFSGGAASLDDFGRQVADALNALDERALHRLRVTRGEFERILWPEFPESRPITRITAEDAWSFSEPRSLTAASRTIGLHGGKHLRFDRVEWTGMQSFTNFDLYRGVTIVATDETSGEPHRIPLAPSVASRHGRFKALLFRD
jgi:hypothetical protein